tara:strand:+ start:19880 stop:20998 length:1119 start_codon:yes stop_codon:yes gene_type:complete
MEKPSHFIKGFNEIRALAAFGVLWCHVELYKHREGRLSMYDGFLERFIDGLGKNMVDVFFVLSGFLITVLLLLEQKKHERISIKKFYIRRVLRIWPLYFLVLGISFFVLPFIVLNTDWFLTETHYYNLINTVDYTSAFPYFMLFLSNVALVLRLIIPGASQSWSISVEEQFYVFWPWVIRIFRNYLLPFFLIFVVIKIAINHTNEFVSLSHNEKIVLKVIKTIRVEMMALGGLGAYLLFMNNKIYTRICRLRVLPYVILPILLGMLLLDKKGIIFGIIITLIFSYIYANQSKIREFKFISNLGNISYGIYMYHPLVMFLCFSVLNKLKIDTITYNLLAYSTIILGTILLSSLSYKFLESGFLKLKNRVYSLL